MSSQQSQCWVQRTLKTARTLPRAWLIAVMPRTQRLERSSESCAVHRWIANSAAPKAQQTERSKGARINNARQAPRVDIDRHSRRLSAAMRGIAQSLSRRRLDGRDSARTESSRGRAWAVAAFCEHDVAVVRARRRPPCTDRLALNSAAIFDRRWRQTRCRGVRDVEDWIFAAFSKHSLFGKNIRGDNAARHEISGMSLAPPKLKLALAPNWTQTRRSPF